MGRRTRNKEENESSSAEVKMSDHEEEEEEEEEEARDVVAWASLMSKNIAEIKDSDTSDATNAVNRCRTLLTGFSRQYLAKGKGILLRQELESKTSPVVSRLFESLADTTRDVLTMLEDQSRLATDSLEAIATIILAWLTGLQESSRGALTKGVGMANALQGVSLGLKRCTRLLHDALFIVKSARDLQWKVCRICELWWTLDLPEKGQLVTHALPVLLIFSLEDDAKRADVKRVFNIRKMLSLLDLDDDSSLTLKQLLLRCFLSPLYLFNEDGRKFLSEICCLNEEFVADIHLTIKTQLPYASPKESSMLAESYADVYFRAWQSAFVMGENGMVSVIETEMIQDLMDAGVHVADPDLARTVFTILTAGFHDNKHIRGVDTMLLRLYNPILWRALNVANPTVRFNATRLLARAFPLQDTDASVAETDQVLQKQFSAIETLLRDKSPQVRVAAVQGACRMLSVYWELIPKKATISLLSTLVGDLLRDANSSEVRVAVLRGLEFISENPLTHGALHDILPHTSPLIHDQSRQVRNALLSLLIRVKSMRSIKFYEVVQVDHLLERLAMDVSLGSKLSKLLLDSFYPQGAKGSEQLSRALSLLKSHAAAATAFFTNVHKHVSIGSACKLALLLGKWIENEVGITSSSKQSRSKSKALTLGVDGSPILTSALRGVAAIWRSIATQLASPRYKTARGQMEEAFGYDSFIRPVANSSRLDSKRDMPALLEVAGQLPCESDFAAEVAADLYLYEPEITYGEYKSANTSRGSGLPSQFLTHVVRDLGPVLECLCTWGRVDTIVNSIIVSLEAVTKLASQGKGRPSKAQKRGSKTKPGSSAVSDAEGNRTMDLLVALSCLQHLLANNPHGFRSELFGGTFEPQLVRLTNALTKMRDEPFVLETLLKLTLHRSASQHNVAEEVEVSGLVEEDEEDEPRGVLSANGRTTGLSSRLPRILQQQLSDALQDIKLENENVSTSDASNTGDFAHNDDNDSVSSERKKTEPKKKRKSAIDVASKKQSSDALRRKNLLLVAIAECTALGLCTEASAKHEAQKLHPDPESRAGKRFGIVAA